MLRTYLSLKIFQKIMNILKAVSLGSGLGVLEEKIKIRKKERVCPVFNFLKI